MGSKNDFEPVMKHAVSTLELLGISYETKIVSAHRTPEWMFEYAKTAESRGLKVIIAGAGGAAHLPGMVASETQLPVIGVPVPGQVLDGLDALLSINQMPQGIPVATMAIGKSGAINAAFFAARILSLIDPKLKERLETIREERKNAVLSEHVP